MKALILLLSVFGPPKMRPLNSPKKRRCVALIQLQISDAFLIHEKDLGNVHRVIKRLRIVDGARFTDVIEVVNTRTSKVKYFPEKMEVIPTDAIV